MRKAWPRRDFLRAGVSGFLSGGMGLLAACTTASQSGQQRSSVTPVNGGHIVEGTFADATYMTPYLARDTVSSQVSALMFESLLSCKPDGTLIPALAASHQVSSDGLTYTFKLRPGLKWSDGQPLTSADVLFTYSLHFDPKYRAVNSPRRGDFELHVESIAAPDEETFVLRTRSVYAPLLINMAGPGFALGIMPRHVLGGLSPAALNTTDFNRAPTVTNGVFKFVRWDSGQQIVLERNEHYWGGPSHVDQYVLKVLPDQATVANQVKSGEVDFAIVGEDFVDDLLAHSDTLAVAQFDVAIFDYYGYQLDPTRPASSLFGDKRVRQALYYALNREQIVDTLYFGHASVATGPILPVYGRDYDKDARPQYPYDKARAEALLDEAGWKRNTATGIREKDGVPLEFEVVTNAGNKMREAIVRLLQQQWAAIGVRCTPRLILFADLVTKIRNARDFDMYLIGYSWGADPDPSQVWHSRNTAPGGNNGMGFKNAQVDSLLDRAVGTLDQGKRKQLYYQFQELLNDELPGPVLTFRKGFWAINNRARGVTGGRAGLGAFTQFYPRPWMKDVYVTDGK